MSNPFEQAPSPESNEFFTPKHAEAITTFEGQNPYNGLDGDAFFRVLEETS